MMMTTSLKKLVVAIALLISFGSAMVAAVEVHPLGRGTAREGGVLADADANIAPSGWKFEPDQIDDGSVIVECVTFGGTALSIVGAIPPANAIQDGVSRHLISVPGFSLDPSSCPPRGQGRIP
jgi:hypothetical protein